jgi:hypothetical protein
VHRTATYKCDDTRDCITQFCHPDDEHMCSKHVEARNKLIIKFSASSWLILRNFVTYEGLSDISGYLELRIRLGQADKECVTKRLRGDPLSGNVCGSLNHI